MCYELKTSPAFKTSHAFISGSLSSRSPLCTVPGLRLQVNWSWAWVTAWLVFIEAKLLMVELDNWYLHQSGVGGLRFSAASTAIWAVSKMTYKHSELGNTDLVFRLSRPVYGDYKYPCLVLVVMICATLVNTQTDSAWPVVLVAQPSELKTDEQKNF